METEREVFVVRWKERWDGQPEFWIDDIDDFADIGKMLIGSEILQGEEGEGVHSEKGGSTSLTFELGPLNASSHSFRTCALI